jgi:membrane dipeptidase
LIVDLHSDLLLDIYQRRVGGECDVFRSRHLPELQAAGVRVQVLAVFCPTVLVPEMALRHALRVIDAAHRDADESAGALRIVTDQAGLEEALSSGAVAGILGLEGADPLGRDPELMDVFWRLGVRVCGLTWNRANAFADGCSEDRGAGLTPLGEELLAQMQARGVICDVSHLAPSACHAVLERFGGAVMASHSNAAAVYDYSRNIDDTLIRGISQRGGVVGLNFIPAIIGPGDPIQGLKAHCAHIRSVGGTQVPAIGADFIGFLGDGPAEPARLRLGAGHASHGAGTARAEPARAEAYAALAAVIDDADSVLASNALRFLRSALRPPLAAAPATG